MDLRGKTVIITGASSGIGRACASRFGREGANLSIAARNRDRLEQTRKELEAAGVKALAVACDVSNETDCRKLIDETVTRYGGIDILINNAGISMRALFRDVDLKVIRQVMDINFWGTVYCTKYALPHVLKSGGSLVAISSIAGFRGLPARAGYSASKHAVHGLWETLRTEHLRDNIHFMLVCPGFTESNIRKLALDREGKPQGESPREEQAMMPAGEVALHVLRGLQRRKRTVILTAQGKLTVLINKFFPAWMDRMVYNHLAKEKDSPF